MREDEGREGPVNSASARGEGSVCRESIYVYTLLCVGVCREENENVCQGCLPARGRLGATVVICRGH